MSILVVSSAFLHLLKYGYYLSENYNNATIVSAILPKSKLSDYLKIENQIPENRHNLCLNPIILKTPNNKLRNLLNPIYLVNDFLQILSTIRRTEPDHIICFYVLDAYPFIILKPFFNYTFSVVALGGDINLHKGKIHQILIKFILERSDKIFAVSDDLIRIISNTMNKDSILMPTGIDTKVFKILNENKGILRKSWNIKKDDIVILTACNLNKEKGVETILKSLKLFLKTNNAILIIAGKGPDKDRLTQISKNIGISSNVLFIGHRTRHEIIELLNLSDIFVLSSYSEGLPSIVLESMAAGCITISTDVGDVSKVIIDKKTGFIFQPGDCTRLAETLLEVTSLTESNKMIIKKRARELVEKNYEIRDITKKLIKLIIT